jgi:hypothetical protein
MGAVCASLKPARPAKLPNGGSIMVKLPVIVFIILAPTLALAAVIVVLSSSLTMASGAAMLYAFGVGIVLAIPGSWFIAKMIERQTRNAA